MYSTEPGIVGCVDCVPTEMCFVQYMPIMMDDAVRIPDRLNWTWPIIDTAMREANNFEYMYLSAKYLWVKTGNMGNRPGWHSDGFMTDDVNYIWCDSAPTEFAIQEFKLSMDHEKSMVEMAKQVNPENIRTYNPQTVLRLDQYNIHRPSESAYEGMRAFVKISLSNERYNLIGNARNELFDYHWEMKQRSTERNHPVK